MATIAERIKEGLAIRSMKQADLVERTGIGKSSISTYISGSYEPKQKNIYKIAKALNVNEAWLIGFDVPMDRNHVPESSTVPDLVLNSLEQQIIIEYRKADAIAQAMVLRALSISIEGELSWQNEKVE